MPEHGDANIHGDEHVYEIGADDPLRLDCGVDLAPVRIAHRTYGQLNADKSNAILICHALTGDQFAAEPHPVTGKPGWWSTLIGPGKTIDTRRYFVICSNVLGGCMGSTGPGSIDPATGRPYGLGFPVITIADMVRAQKRLIDHLGITRLFSVIGGSMGGMQVLQWAASYPEAVFSAIPIACSARHSAQNIAFHEIGRQAVIADPDWSGGRYATGGGPDRDAHNPRRGLAIARMIAHITYLSETALHRKFGRSLQDRPKVAYGFDADFQVESYLRHQGITFVERFDANSYLYITRAMDYFDLSAGKKGGLATCFAHTPVRFCVISFTSDWLFPTTESREIVRALNAAAANVSFAEIKTDKGHDAFLLHEPEFYGIVSGFLNGAWEHFERQKSVHPSPNTPRPGLKAPPVTGDLRPDLQIVADWVRPRTRILDVGCGDGALLAHLIRHKSVDGRGMEISQEGVDACATTGLSVIQGDADVDLGGYPGQAFDCVILSQTIQATRDPAHVLTELTRIGRRAIVSFPNFGYWPVRLSFLQRGEMPVTRMLDQNWHNTANIHLCTLRDFTALCHRLGLAVKEQVFLRKGRIYRGPWPNTMSDEAIFILSQGDTPT